MWKVKYSYNDWPKTAEFYEPNQKQLCIRQRIQKNTKGTENMSGIKNIQRLKNLLITVLITITLCSKCLMVTNLNLLKNTLQ